MIEPATIGWIFVALGWVAVGVLAWKQAGEADHG